MAELQKAALPIIVVACVAAVYAVVLGFGLETVFSPVLAAPSATEASTTSRAVDGPTLQSDDSGHRVATPATYTTAELAVLDQVRRYVEMRDGIERKLASEFPALGTQRIELAQLIVDESLQHHIDPWITYSMIKVESQFDVNAVGGAGEIGLMQVMPATGRMVAERSLGISTYRAKMLFDPAFNIKVALTHLAYLVHIYNGNLMDALTAYNAGHANVTNRSYARRVLRSYAEYQKPLLDGTAEVAAIPR